MTVLKTETETAVFPVIPTETDRVLTIQNRNNTRENILRRHLVLRTTILQSSPCLIIHILSKMYRQCL